MKSRILIVGLAVMAGGAAAAYAPADDYISGRVTDEVTGEPLAGICVWAHVKPTGQVGAVTQRNGTYRIGGLEQKTYEVRFEPCRTEGYASEYYNDRPFGLEDRVQPPASGIDAALGPGAWISGRVTSALTGEPLAGVCVGAEPPNNEAKPVSSDDETTEADGTFSIPLIGSGTVAVVAKEGGCAGDPYPPDGSTQGYDRDGNGVLDPVRTRLGQVTRGIEIALVPLGAIEGKLVDKRTGAPVEACIHSAFDGEGSVFSSNFGIQAKSDERGRYRLTGLPPGAYELSFDVDCSGPFGDGDPDHWAGWSVPYGRLDEANLNTFPRMIRAQPVAVQAGRTKRGIDAALYEGGRISGTVFDPSGNPLEGACVQAIFLEGPGDRPFGRLLTDAAGRYRSGGLPTGRYAVHIARPNSARPWSCEGLVRPRRPGDWVSLIGSWVPHEGTIFYGGARTIDDAVVVRVWPGLTTGGIDAEIDAES